VLKLVRFSGIGGAIVWLIGLPVIGFSGVISSDGEYFSMGIVAAMVGLITAPLGVAESSPRARPLSHMTRVVGATACVGLVVTGVLLVAGASGSLGERAPTWVIPAAEVALAVFFLWVLLATYSAHRSKTAGRTAWWLAVLAVVSFLITLVFPLLGPGVTSTNAAIPFELVLLLLLWLCPPAWLIVIAVAMRTL
jgi:hypothetical protein